MPKKAAEMKALLDATLKEHGAKIPTKGEAERSGFVKKKRKK
jgi:hypothetical protein